MCKSESDEYFTTQCKERQLQEILVDISPYVYNDGLAVKSKYKDTHWISDWYHQRTQHVTCSFFVWLKWIFLKISLCCKQKNFTWKRLFEIPQVTRDQESKELECQPWCCGYMYWQYCIFIRNKTQIADAKTTSIQIVIEPNSERIKHENIRWIKRRNECIRYYRYRLMNFIW